MFAQLISSEVQAMLVQWYAGEGVGTALANILFGDVNPSGKLAMTFPASDSDGPTTTQAAFPGAYKGTAWRARSR